MKTAEQQARDILERMDIEGAQTFTAGDVAELSKIIRERDHLVAVIDYISKAAGSSSELYPVGPAGIEYADDGNTVVRYIGPWRFNYSEGETFLEAVEKDMRM
jgi:hypothetical protein